MNNENKEVSFSISYDKSDDRMIISLIVHCTFSF